MVSSVAQYNPTKSLGAVSVGPMKLWNTEPPSLMSDGDAMDARLDAAALASKEEDTMDARLDAAALASKEEDAARIVQWTGRLDPTRLNRSYTGDIYTFITATHDGVNWVDFYMDRGWGATALAPATFGCAVELGLEVRFSAALQPRVTKGRQGPAARLSELQRATFRRAVDAACGAVDASEAGSSTTDLASALAPMMRLLEQQSKLIDEQRAEQRRQGAQMGQLLHGGSATLDAIEALQKQLDRFCDLSETLKEAAAQSIDRHKAKVPHADEAKMPSFGVPDGSARLQARADAAKRVDDFLRPLFGDDWAMLHASAPRQGPYTVHGKETGSGVERPYNVPKPEEVLRRTISMYEGMRRRASPCTARSLPAPRASGAAYLAPHPASPCGGSKFACRPLGRASTDEVWKHIYAAWGPQAVWCGALGFGPETEINVTPNCKFRT
eukprot:scaffold37807_cov56-Phaeocystis_antarctica.AAC.4